MTGYPDKHEEQTGAVADALESSKRAQRRFPHVNILGTEIAAVNPGDVVALLRQWIGGERFGRYVCVTGVHGIMEGLRDENVRLVHNEADLCVPDGMPLVWVSRLRGHRDTRRVYGPDLMLAALALAEKEGLTSYFYGGGPGLAERLREEMLARFPALKIVGTHSPPFRDLTGEEQDEVLERINALEPDLLWIGLSTPKQEKLMSAFRLRVRAKVMLGVGAAFDFNAGTLPQAPKWMQASGLEWFFRLCMEPRRLWRRYMRNNPSFLFHLLLQALRLRSYPTHGTRPGSRRFPS